MATITYEDYRSSIKKISDIRYRLEALSKAISISASVLDMLKRYTNQCYVIRDMLKTIKKIVEFSNHEYNYKDILEIKEDLEFISINLKHSKEVAEQHWLFSSVVKIQKRTLDELDDVIENFAIASDQEIQELSYSISNKIKQEYAIH